jgi:hypothetical protein
VNITNVAVLDNPTAFLNPFQFEISYECLVPLDDGKAKPPFYPSVPLLPIWLLCAMRRRRRARVSSRRGPFGDAVFGSVEPDMVGGVRFCSALFCSP